jgi:antitoxin HigA-1
MSLVCQPIHPGEILSDELKELEITASDLSRAIDVPANRIYQIINGQRAITADTALRLGLWFGSGAELWLDLQRDYDLRVAKAALADTLKKIPHRPDAPIHPTAIQLSLF